MVVRTYKIDPSHAGLVIGRGGKDLRALQEISGVLNVNFDTRSSSRSYTLQVSGINGAACEAVYNEIQKRINHVKWAIPEVAKTFIDINDRSLDTIELVPFGIGRRESVSVRSSTSRSSQRYIISSFIRGNLSDTFDMKIQETSNTKSSFMEFLEKNISASFQEALHVHQGTPNEKMSFHLSPGKVIFIGPNSGSRLHLLRSKITGSNGSEYMKQKGLKTFFTPTLEPKYIPLVNKRLAELGFEVLNEGCPETYTTVHLYVGAENSQFSVVLALDKNLETPKELSDEPRLSEEKKKIIKKILDAKTIGDVMPSDGKSVKVKFRKMTLHVHPDKNLHPGATEAFQKLNDAYEKLSAGERIDTPALMVENNTTDSTSKLPPKVVKVKTKKIRMCTVTTLSDKDLDIRGSLVGYEEDKDNLSEHIKEAVNLCWDQRDSSGRIPTAKGKSQIIINCVKQVLEAHDWAKEIPYGSGGKTAVLEIKIKKLREKSGTDVMWNDCVEIDLNLNRDSGDRTILTGESLAKEIIELKEWVERIFI